MAVELVEVGDRAAAEESARIYTAVFPDDPLSGVDVERALAANRDRIVLLGSLDGAAVGTAVSDSSSIVGRCYVGVRVQPEARRRGVGQALLLRCAAHGRTLGREILSARVTAGDEAGLAFAARHGFVEVSRDVELVLEVRGDEQRPFAPEGIEIVSVAARPDVADATYEVACEAIVDIPGPPRTPPAEARWLAEQVQGPGVLADGTMVALEDGLVVGVASLLDRDAAPGLAEHGLTAVRRSHRGRGIATLLKRTQIAWAAAHGYRELITATAAGNVPMRAVNERLGYAERPATIDVEAQIALVESLAAP
jgi:GNAT superfamily N-acetyltransferase